jgi:hypothetical protein
VKLLVGKVGVVIGVAIGMVEVVVGMLAVAVAIGEVNSVAM